MKGNPVQHDYNVDMETDKITTIEDDIPDSGIDESLKTDVSEGIKLLDDKEFEDYLQAVGSWVFQDTKYTFHSLDSSY
jgi:hypothetical protein